MDADKKKEKEKKDSPSSFTDIEIAAEALGEITQKKVSQKENPVSSESESSIIDDLSRTLSSATEAIDEQAGDFLEGASNIAGDIISGAADVIGSVVKNIDIDIDL